MYIIADVEWVQNKENKQSPTQLSAVRVDNEWNIVDEFSSYHPNASPSKIIAE